MPTQEFVLFILQQYLTTSEYNDNIDVIMSKAEVKYSKKPMPTDFLYGKATGSVGPVEKFESTFFVRNRMMCPQPSWVSQLPAKAVPQLTGNPCYFAPFFTSADGKSVVVNLGNSLPTDVPGFTPWEEVLGELWLVALPKGKISPNEATPLAQIPHDEQFISQNAGFFSATLEEDVSDLPLGILSVLPSGDKHLLLAENKDGHYLRADQFVYRMNPGMSTTTEFPRGDTASVDIHVLKFGQPVKDGTQITMTMMTETEALLYTPNTLGTSGSNGIKNVSVPQDALKLTPKNPPDNPASGKPTSVTVNSIATFNLSCTPPGNPRHYVDGQVYFLNYGFGDPSIGPFFIQNQNDLVSIQVYNEKAEEAPADILAKWGRLYKIMNFLTDEGKVKQIDRRNMIKLLLEKPFTELQHMPVTRDMSEPQRAKIVSWINELNSQ